jgi:transglutaminase-like putative cysteine protease
VRRGAIRATGLVETHASPWLVDAPGLPSPLVYLRPTELTPQHASLRELGAPLAGGVDVDRLLKLAKAVCERVAYRAGATTVATHAAEALALGAGVCQDQAHVFIAACRPHGVPARYVSGYFYAPDSPALASHAWADVCVDVAQRRWLSVDVTHGCLMDERHVRLAVGPDYAACLPIRGIRHGGGEEAMRVSVAIRPD